MPSCQIDLGGGGLQSSFVKDVFARHIMVPTYNLAIVT